jgi:dTMP kinase
VLAGVRERTGLRGRKRRATLGPCCAPQEFRGVVRAARASPARRRERRDTPWAVNRGALVALEGLDGCGKTYAARADRGRRCAARGRDVVPTREPSDGPIGREIRELARKWRSRAAERELALFTDDRREHVALVIAPALAAGRWVLTDRYFLSTVAYQGARGLDWRAILASSEAEFPGAGCALVFELPPAEASRARARAAAPRTVVRAGRVPGPRRGYLRRDRPPLRRARRRVGQRRGGDRACARRAAGADRFMMVFARLPAFTSRGSHARSRRSAVPDPSA